MLNSAVHLFTKEATLYANSKEPPERGDVLGAGHVYLQAPYGIYETADGYLAVSLSPCRRRERDRT